MSKTPNPPNRVLWWVTVCGTLLSVPLLIGFAGALALADPHRPHTIVWEDSDMGWAGDPSQDLAPDERRSLTIPQAIPAERAQLTVTAQQSGDPSAAWGLWVAVSDGYAVVMVTAEGSSGYVAAWRCPSLESPLMDCDPLAPWTQAIFLKQDQANRVALVIEPNQKITLRLNHEWMWDLPISDVGMAWGIIWQGGATDASLQLVSARVGVFD